MGDALTKTEEYLFILGLILIILVYFGGGVKLLQAAGPQAVALDYAATGRTPQGTFAPYATGGPIV